MATGIDWEKVRELLDAEEWQRDEYSLSDDEFVPVVRSIYIGTVFALAPSGKYWTFWAHSNIEICDNCRAFSWPCGEQEKCTPPDNWNGDTEYHCEACQDVRFWDEIEDEAIAHGLSVESSEGDPCDVLISEYSVHRSRVLCTQIL